MPNFYFNIFKIKKNQKKKIRFKFIFEKLFSIKFQIFFFNQTLFNQQQKIFFLYHN